MREGLSTSGHTIYGELVQVVDISLPANMGLSRGVFPADEYLERF